MKHILPSQIIPARPAFVSTMPDVRDWILSHTDPQTGKNPLGYLLQYLTTLQSHCHGAPLETIFTSGDLLAEFDEVFPKPRKDKHPRPDLGQDLDAYKVWRRRCRLAITKATGQEDAKKVLRGRQDGWTELLEAAKLHTVESSLVHTAVISPLTTLSDIARRVGLEPWHLDDDEALNRLESGFETRKDRDHVRRAYDFLNKYRFIPEIAALIPAEVLPVPSKAQAKLEIPSHIDDLLISWADKATAVGKTGSRKDLVTGKDRKGNSKSTRDGYLAALRHHVRTLPNCPVDPDLDYLRPIKSLDAVNDVHGIFAVDHLAASLRRTAAVEHLPGTIIKRTAYSYYWDVVTVLARNEIDVSAMTTTFKSSVFLEEGKELSQGMTQATEDWCRALLHTPDRKRRFRCMHRILQAQAQEILDLAAAEGRDLTSRETTKVRQLGTAAAASAIQLAGRPIRLANVMGFRQRGASRNFFEPNPKQARPHYTFTLEAQETKANKKAPAAKLREELYGPQVMSWYLNTIRPLFPHADKSIYLFPAVDTPDAPLGTGTFDTWFQAATSGAKLPMTFHRFRHGYATLLLKNSWSNLGIAAKMLGNTPEVCARNYAWLEEEDLFEQGQDILIAESYEL